MANINEILARAAALREETALNSISPERAGGIMYDTLMALNELWLQQGAALVISKIYASVDAMEADTNPVSDISGKPLRPGQIVVIASEDEDNGSVYRYNGTDSPSWSLVGNIGNLEPVDSLDSDSTQLPLAAHQGKVLDGKISQLGQELLRQSILDLSWLHRTGDTLATYATLTDAINDIPSAYRFDGITIRFIDSTKGKYVRYSLIKDSYSSNVSYWQGVDDTLDINSIGLLQNNAISKEVQIKKPVALIKNFDGIEIIQGIITGQGKWNYIQNTYESYVVKIKGGDSLSIVANESYPCDIAFLRSISDNYSNGDTPDFSTETGYTARLRVTANSSQSFIAPSDANYLVVLRLVEGENRTPKDISINGLSISYDVRSILDVPTNLYFAMSGFISMQNKWGTKLNKSIVYSIKPNADIRIVASADFPADIAFLKSIPATYVEGDTPDFSTETGYTARIRVTANTTQSFEVPSDANYLLINAVVSNDSILPSAISFNGYDAYRSVRDSVSLLLSSKNNSTDERTIENNAAKAYLNTILYDNEDYTYSFIDDYDTIVTPYRKDQPFPTVIELPDIQGISVIEIGDNFGFSENISVSDETSIDVYNLIPNREYFAKAKDSSDNVLASFRFVPKGELRMIKCDSLINIRDIGGWENLDGNKIKYGKIIRGCTMEGDYPISETDKGILLDVVGINAELDLRTDAEAGYATESVLGSSVSYVRIDPPRWDDFTSATITSAVSKAVTMFRQVLSFLSDGKTIYTHCKGGADRTGCVIMILEAVSGISESSMLKDYELTSFSSYGERKRDDTSADYPMHYCLPYIKANYQGSTLSEKWIALLKSGGVTDTEITTFRELMLK